MSEPQEIEVDVLFFARARELAGRARATLRLPAGATVAEAGSALEAGFPSLRICLKACRFAVDEEFAPASRRLADRAVLAVIPPVSGGV